MTRTPTRTPSRPRPGRPVLSVLLGGGLTLALTGTGLPSAAAQGGPVDRPGGHYYLAGAGNSTGRASQDFDFGDPGDEVYVGDFVGRGGAVGGDGRDDVLVRRGNMFTIRGQGGRTFSYGDPGDTVLVGDWNGDGTDTLAVRRGNVFFVTDSIGTGVADYTFTYGDPRDEVLVGNWDGDTSAPDAAAVVTTDTLLIRRGNRFFVKNSTTTGVADYDFVFGNPGDTVLVGDWATPPVATGGGVVPGVSGDYADQLAVRRGDTYFPSEEVWTAAAAHAGYRLPTRTSFRYGEPGDVAFTAQLAYTYDANGVPATLYGDGLGVRRAERPGAPEPPGAAAAPGTAGRGTGVRTYLAVGDSITTGMVPGVDSLDAPGPTSWLSGESAGRLVRVGGWAAPGTITEDMRAGVLPSAADVLVLLAGTNDVARGIPWPVTEANLRAIAARSGARETVLVAVPPSAADPAGRTAFNARLAALAGPAGWHYLDPWTAVAVGGAWAPGSTVDGVHPTPQAASAAGRLIGAEAWQAAARRGR